MRGIKVISPCGDFAVVFEELFKKWLETEEGRRRLFKLLLVVSFSMLILGYAIILYLVLNGA